MSVAYTYKYYWRTTYKGKPVGRIGRLLAYLRTPYMQPVPLVPDKLKKVRLSMVKRTRYKWLPNKLKNLYFRDIISIAHCLRGSKGTNRKYTK